MPDAISVAVAKEVTAMLAAADLSQDFEPERSYADWQLELKSAGTLRVDVVAVTTKQEVELAARGGAKFYTIPVDIAVRQKFGQAAQDEDTGRIEIATVDELVYLVQEIHELFLPNRLENFQAGVWQETKLIANPLHHHLQKLRQFTGIVRVTFKAEKD
jgi:hypothetical protein